MRAQAIVFVRVLDHSMQRGECPLIARLTEPENSRTPRSKGAALREIDQRGYSDPTIHLAERGHRRLAKTLFARPGVFVYVLTERGRATTSRELHQRRDNSLITEQADPKNRLMPSVAHARIVARQ
jgi:hypothetical protein